MPSTATTARKSPLRAVATPPVTTAAPVAARPARSKTAAAVAQRESMIEEFADVLRAKTNRNGRPYAPRTIGAYRDAAIALHHWMTKERIYDGFTGCDVDTLNRFFRWYQRTHDRKQHESFTGGTNTKQRNLRHLFTWLAEEYDHPHPWDDKKFQRYSAPQDATPKTLSDDFIKDVLKVTEGGSPRVRDFERTRDHAMIRVLTEGVRADELLRLTVDSLHLEEGVLQVPPIKGARAARAGRIVPLQPKTVIALRRYLRAREGHRHAGGGYLWLGTRGRGHLKYSGLYRMLNRRSEQAGYGKVAPHMHRHTWTHEMLEAGVSAENVMEAGGWKDRSMLRRYAADMAAQRAVSAIHQLGDRH
ncbi:site-specific integrase [Streptomyces sp. ISL-99]|uniref:tyrosine-type recombinase/integrase n=1 Tax=Streptomyces sp. ISL-99 TaxID=2819193 RepID=UPI002034DD72|nr:site-specific integrase [Streptomyces sp. ISL-99]